VTATALALYYTKDCHLRHVALRAASVFPLPEGSGAAWEHAFVRRHHQVAAKRKRTVLPLDQMDFPLEKSQLVIK
jgi:hypothetical protein